MDSWKQENPVMTATLPTEMVVLPTALLKPDSFVLVVLRVLARLFPPAEMEVSKVGKYAMMEIPSMEMVVLHSVP